MPAALVLALCVLVLAWVYRVPVSAYLRDQHYQEHFVFLWAFFALALWRTLRGPFRRRIGVRGRDALAVSSAALAGLTLWTSFAGGSGTGQRLSLALCLLAFALACVPRWTGRRCLMHALLFVLCFGVPYSVYFPVTSQLQWGVAGIIGLPAAMGCSSYEMVGHVVMFPHYQLVITADCSGIGQLLSFLGIAALGALSSAPNRRRTLLVFGVACALAWLSNLVRVGAFVLLVGCGYTKAVDDPVLHAAIGLLVFMPFVIGLVALILRTHVPYPTSQLPAMSAAPGRIPAAWLLAPVVVASLSAGGERATPMPAYWPQVSSPPGHTLAAHAPSEELDRSAYVTPWLINARFEAPSGRSFDLLHYVTESRSHLCVHKVANCLQAPEAQLRYEESVLVAGRRWWRLAIDAGELSSHVYFAFEVAGQRCDDSWTTSWRVFVSRLFGRDGAVRLTRVTFPGALPAAPDAYEAGVLGWLDTLGAAPAQPSPR
ncbi:MAG: archaeosortase/exosortase family protein [Planctomycetes bacterium]|nr:archaeosortase/exosortase family protein [Planctomycetota bacterium]MCB9884067.1 archaeosortase/exosortase family protein [Planctomycetota bacterium]